MEPRFAKPWSPRRIDHPTWSLPSRSGIKRRIDRNAQQRTKIVLNIASLRTAPKLEREVVEDLPCSVEVACVTNIATT